MNKLKEEEYNVDLPTEGDEVEVELEEAKPVEAGAESTEQEQSAEESTTDKDIEERATSVQRRIDKLTKKMREAERQRMEALRYAEKVQEENRKLKTNQFNLDKGYTNESANRIESQMEAVKEKLKSAIAAGDPDAQIQANELLARLAAENERYKIRQKELIEQEKEYAAQEQQPVQQSQQQYQEVEPDPRAEEWLENNTWFRRDRAMRNTALEIHQELVEKEGFDPSSDEYYTEIDKRIREEFPHRFEDTKQVAQKPVQTVAPATRTANNSGRKKIRLSPSQVAIAKKLGVPISEYAKFVKE